MAKADPNGLYNTAMGDPVADTIGANIQRTGSSPNYSYSVAADWANRPVNYVSFWDAARFANWLHNGQPTGPQGPGTTEDGAYHDVGNQTLFGRNAGAKFFIPTENEWYKAAYHDKTAGLAASYFDYPTGTNAAPGNDITETTNPGNNANYYNEQSTRLAARTIARLSANSSCPTVPTARSIKAATCGSGTKRISLCSSSRGLRGGSFTTASLHSRPRWRSYRSFNTPASEVQHRWVPRGKYLSLSQARCCFYALEVWRCCGGDDV